MPLLDGYATTQLMRDFERLHQRPRTKIVALTADALSGAKERCLASGMDDYLAKPFTIDQLQAVLELGGTLACSAPSENDGTVD